MNEVAYVSRRAESRRRYEERLDSLSRQDRANAIYEALHGLHPGNLTAGVPVYFEYWAAERDRESQRQLTLARLRSDRAA